MRDINRIDKILNEINDIWKQFPDLRLGQLISNVVRDPSLYYIEDDDLVAVLKKFYVPEKE